MTEKRTIDPKFYGVASHANVPSYNIPYVATGHLMYYPARDTHEALCGVPHASLHNRIVERPNKPWKEPWKVCKRCLKVAANEGLVEWTMPPLKKNECPVYSERVGAPSKHIMLPRRPRCTACPPPEKYRLTERCRRKHPTYSKCSGCGLTDENKH